MGPTRSPQLPTVDDYTTDPAVVRTIDALGARWRERRPVVSNIIDDEGHQYVDLVMQGGGTLGIALVGYIYALESVGIRFKSIGGTSAGAITATLLAGLDTPSRPKSNLVLEAIAEMDMQSFLDSPQARHKKLVLAIALARHQEYHLLVQRIDTGDINWLDFNMPADDRLELFRLGVEAAAHFLINRFDWQRYQCLRAEVDGREPPPGCDKDEVAEDPGPDHPGDDDLKRIYEGERLAQTDAKPGSL